MSLQRGDQVFQSAGGMADGVERCQMMKDPAWSDALNRVCDGAVLFGKDRAQIQQHAAIFDAGQDGWIATAQASGEPFRS